ncbi:hypothetical protein HQ524_04380 [Candidatus Uhrbacteria bacterium]|nr:hypothetical protein [Candidatus Uhrbacteria bacterium]
MKTNEDFGGKGFWFSVQHPGVLWLKFENAVFCGFTAPNWWPGKSLWQAFKWFSRFTVLLMTFVAMIVVYVKAGVAMPVLYSHTLAGLSLSTIVILFCLIVFSPVCLMWEMALTSWQVRHHEICIYKLSEYRAQIVIVKPGSDFVDGKEVFRIPVSAFFGKLIDYNSWMFYVRPNGIVRISDRQGQSLDFGGSNPNAETVKQRLLSELTESLAPGLPDRDSWWGIIPYINSRG